MSIQKLAEQVAWYEFQAQSYDLGVLGKDPWDYLTLEEKEKVKEYLEEIGVW